MPNYPGAANGKTQLVYSTSNPSPAVLGQGVTGVCFNAETPTPAQASAQFGVAPGPGDVQIRVVSLEILFSGDPGVFEIDLQDSDIDADAFYQNVSGGSITQVSSNFTARIEVQIKGRFVRCNLVSRTNSVALTARVTG